MRILYRILILFSTVLIISSTFYLKYNDIVPRFANGIVSRFPAQSNSTTESSVQSKQNSSHTLPVTPVSRINVLPRLKTVFDGIYHKRFWGSQGGGSGPGSTVDFTNVLRSRLKEMFVSRNISSMADIPCGGMVWTREFLKDIWKVKPHFKYFGFDIVSSVIDTLHKNFVDPRAITRQFDIVAGKPDIEVDAVLCRDMLQHLSLRDCCKALTNLVNIDTKYVLLGSYELNKGGNRNIKAGQYFLINLSKPPFNFPPPLQALKERPLGSETKFVYVYQQEKLKDHIKKWNCEKFG